MARVRIRVSGLKLLVAASIPFEHAPWKSNLDNGCWDSDCCSQHPGYSWDGEPMVAIEVPMSGHEFHRRYRSAVAAYK